jgi:hypothetical protein
MQRFLAVRVQRLAEACQRYLNDPGGADTQLALGSWSNANSIVCAYLTCYPQGAMDEERTIEFVVSVQIEQKMTQCRNQTGSLIVKHGIQVNWTWMRFGKNYRKRNYHNARNDYQRH